MRNRRVLADTARGARLVPPGGGDFDYRGEEYRGRAARLRESVGPPVVVTVYDPTRVLTGSLSNSRIFIGGILLAFLLLALASSVFVVRALQDQIGSFLEAARRLAKGDFKHPVPTHGGDEFALLGREFNSMSEQLEAKIDELDSKRRELEETIRRVGAAFASGLDPQGILELTLDTADRRLRGRGGPRGPARPRADLPRAPRSRDRDHHRSDGRRRAGCPGRRRLAGRPGVAQLSRPAAAGPTRSPSPFAPLTAANASTSRSSRSPGPPSSSARSARCSSTWPVRRRYRSRTPTSTRRFSARRSPTS